MMLDWLGQEAAAEMIKSAVQLVFDDPTHRTPDMGGKLGTSALTDLIIKNLDN